MARHECTVPECGFEGWSQVEMTRHTELEHREIADRRARAREAYHDGAGLASDRVEDAIDTAVRVRIGAEVTQAARDAHPDVMIQTRELKDMIAAAFAAAGFEVES